MEKEGKKSKGRIRRKGSERWNSNAEALMVNVTLIPHLSGGVVGGEGGASAP